MISVQNDKSLQELEIGIWKREEMGIEIRAKKLWPVDHCPKYSLGGRLA